MRVILSGGGTGGHIYPAMAIAEQCKIDFPDSEFLYIGSERGLEKDIVPKSGMHFESIEITGFKRKLSWDNVRTIIRFFKGAAKAKKIITSFQPDIVIGTGGYVCGPVVYAAAKLGVPTLIHEQNVIPGLTNHFLSRYVDCVAVSFEGSEKQFPKAKSVVYTGNPRATAVANADAKEGFVSLGLPVDSRIVVVVGGSQGAKAINRAMIEMVPLIEQLSGIHFIYVTGNTYYDSTSETIQKQNPQVPSNLKIVPYVHNMPEVLAATDLIASRAGASFLSEITSLGIPSILIPSPNVTNNHQEKNARWLLEEGAAELVLEQDLNGKSLYAQIEKIMKDPVRCEHMSNQSKRLGQPQSAQYILQQMRRCSGKA